MTHAKRQAKLAEMYDDQTIALTMYHNAFARGAVKRCKLCGDYFIVRHKNQEYCSEPCALKVRRAVKLKWWNENRRPITARADSTPELSGQRSPRRRTDTGTAHRRGEES